MISGCLNIRDKELLVQKRIWKSQTSKRWEEVCKEEIVIGYLNSPKIDPLFSPQTGNSLLQSP